MLEVRFDENVRSHFLSLPVKQLLAARIQLVVCVQALVNWCCLPPLVAIFEILADSIQVYANDFRLSLILGTSLPIITARAAGRAYEFVLKRDVARACLRTRWELFI